MGAIGRVAVAARWQIEDITTAAGVTRLTEMTLAVSAWHDTFGKETVLARFSHNGG